MPAPEIAEYGFWKSPVTSDLIVAETIRLGQTALNGDNAYWLEGRPSEGGRYVIVHRPANGSNTEINPQPFNARTRAHEYGGGAYLVDSDGSVYFSNNSDQRIYSVRPGQTPAPVTPEAEWRFADFIEDAARNRLIAVREDHTNAEREAINEIVEIDLESGAVAVLVSGADFYSNPCLSPGGQRLAWLSWNHPNMPWDGCELCCAPLDSQGRPGPSDRVAGGRDESLFQPRWSPSGELYFVSDRTGWWNLYRQRNGAVEPLAEMEAEFGRPQWVFGQSTYAFESAARIVCAYTQNGQWRLAALDTESKALTPIDCPYTDIADVQAGPGIVLFRGGSPSEPEAIVRLTLDTGNFETLRRSAAISNDLRRYLSIPETIEFPTENSQTAHGFYYAPHNPDHTAPEGELPPLIVISHGGPTGATSSTLSLPIQYWTSRGFGVFDIDYGGSTGYGTAYRRRLNANWGVVDIDDCVNGAKYLAAKGLADPERLIIRGGSAGGYTTLAALAFRGVFRAGASYYGVSDLEALALETHKFESRYMDSMVGPYPETRDLYRARSPIHHVDKLSSPVIFLQGSEDKIVLPNQAELMLAALRKKGVPAAYLLFDGEQHGFRRAENIKRALDAELYFYATMLLRKGLRF